jgi:hypothetical protein
MKNVVFWDMKTQSVPHRRHISLRYRAQPARFDVFTGVTMKNAVF